MFSRTKSFVFSALFFAVIFSIYLMGQQRSEGILEVAIIYPLEHPSLEKIRIAFEEKLSLKTENKLSIHFTYYNGSGNRLLMNQQVEQAFAKKPDLIFSISTISASMILAALQKNHATMPIICGAADIDLLEESGPLPHNLSVVSDVEDYPKQLKLLKKIKPSAQKLLVVYDQGAAKYQRDLKNLFEPAALKENIELLTLPINLPQEIGQKIPLKMDGVDGIMIFKDSTVVSAIESLVKAANFHKVPLYASDLDSVAKGAALGFGIEEEKTGEESGALAARVLLREEELFSQKIFLKPQMLLINTSAASMQGLSIPEDALKESPMGAIYRESLIK